MNAFYKFIRKWTIISVLLFVGGYAAWTYVSLKFVYSRGERAGYVQKFSKKGWIFKTWEGEIAMVNLPGAMPEKFLFSVRSPEVATHLQENMGHRVSLTYEEHRYIPTKIFAETNYFVTNVRVIEDSLPPKT